MKILIIDFETTGLQINADDFSVLELAYSYSEDLNLISSGSFLIKQNNQNIVESKIHNITNDLLLSATKTFTEAQDLIEHLIGKSDIIVAWNGRAFDFKIIAEYFNISIYRVNPNICCLDPVYDADEITTLPIKKLDYCCYHFKTDVRANHRAIYDVLAVFEILTHIDIKKAEQSAREPVDQILISLKYEDTLEFKAKTQILVKLGFDWNKTISKHWHLMARRSKIATVKQELAINNIKITTEKEIKF